MKMNHWLVLGAMLSTGALAQQANESPSGRAGAGAGPRIATGRGRQSRGEEGRQIREEEGACREEACHG